MDHFESYNQVWLRCIHFWIFRGVMVKKVDKVNNNHHVYDSNINFYNRIEVIARKAYTKFVKGPLKLCSLVITFAI